MCTHVKECNVSSVHVLRVSVCAAFPSSPVWSPWQSCLWVAQPVTKLPGLERTAGQHCPQAAGLPRGPDSGQRLGKPADVSEESALLNPPAPSEVLLSFTPAAWAI